MLIDLKKILKDLDDKASSPIDESDIKHAANMLRRHQFIWKEKHGQRQTYDILLKYREYFADLFDAFGDTFHIDTSYGLCHIMPQAKIHLGSLKKLDTIILLILVKLHDLEGRRTNTVNGRSYPNEELILDEYMAITGSEKPTKSELTTTLQTLKSFGIIELGERNAETDMLKITILPSITKIVNEKYLEDLLSPFAANSDVDDSEEDDEGDQDKTPELEEDSDVE